MYYLLESYILSWLGLENCAESGLEVDRMQFVARLFSLAWVTQTDVIYITVTVVDILYVIPKPVQKLGYRGNQ